MILTEAALAILAIGLSYLREENPTGEFSMTANDSFSLAVVALLFLIAWIVALVGLYRFRSWARHLYLGLMVGALALHLVPRQGAPVSALDAFVNSTPWLLSGLVIALSYYSPLATVFRDREPAA